MGFSAARVEIDRRRLVGRRLVASAAIAALTALLVSDVASAQTGGGAGQPAGGAAATVTVRAQVRANPTPPWGKGILPLTPESYYNAIECGKQDAADPPCLFWDTGVCRNDDFTLAWYSPYKQVAYEVWLAVRKKQPAPQPNFQAALRTRVTIGVTPAKGSTNTLKEVRLTRGGTAVAPVDRSLAGGGGRYTFDTPSFAPTASVVLDLVGSARTIRCPLPAAALRQMR